MKPKLITDEEEARIQAGIAADPDNPELTEEQIASAKPFSAVFPALFESLKKSRGRPKIAAPKQVVSIRLSPQTIDYYKSIGGQNWREVMCQTLEKHTPPA